MTTTTTTTSTKSATNPSLPFLGSRHKSKDGEIGIFGAEKYFNGGINEVENQKLPRKTPMKVKPPQIERQKPQEKKTPPRIVPSESSWGSQKAFLQSFPPNPHQKKHKKSFLATIGCNCYCNDEKSVYTNEPPNEAIAKMTGEEHNIDGDHDDKMRNSLEVFGSPMLQNKRNKSLGLEKRLAMLKWDASEVEVDGMCEVDDECSVASSDLFEIASFANNNPNSNSILLRQESDGCVTPTTCYAPSEASVEWSVVTPSAVEFSVFSDSEEPASVQKNVVNASKEVERRRSLGILRGCKSQKAVRVARDAYRTNGEAIHDPQRCHVARYHDHVAKF